MKKQIKQITLLCVLLLILSILPVMVYAEDEVFCIDQESAVVKLNTNKFLYCKNKPLGEDVVWSSSNQNVATVDNGTVTAVGIGNATITATVGELSSQCQITVVYDSITIKSNFGTSIDINLYLSEHPTEQLSAIVKDGKNEVVSNPQVTWKSSDNSVVTISEDGMLTAVKSGNAIITVEAAGVTDTRNVVVHNAPQFTDFTNAKYELLFDGDTELKISGITPSTNSNVSYYCYITKDNVKPTITKNDNGSINTTDKKAEYLYTNTKDNYMYFRNMDKYAELNQDLYLWVVEEQRLDELYYLSETQYSSYATKLVTEGYKLKKPALPQLNMILKSFSLSEFNNSKDNTVDQSTYMKFVFPSATENRKFKVKIGKVTDNLILNKIKNNDYSGITELLAYAKKNSAVFEKDLTTTSENYYSSKTALFDGRKLLTKDAYYYIYVVFDDENGKYVPIEGITLGQAWFAATTSNWDLYAYTDSNFAWNNLSLTPTTQNPAPQTQNPVVQNDPTTAPVVIPKTGKSLIFIGLILSSVTAVVILKIKNDEYKNI